MEFIDFDEPDADEPGIVLVTSYAEGDDLDDAWWPVVVQAGWEGEWWIDDERAARFEGTRDTDPGVADDWAAFVRDNTVAPQWRWYAWIHDPDCGPDCGPDCDRAQMLVPTDDTTDGAFLAARVVLR